MIASPVYYASANATLIACLDRLFYSTSFDKSMKVGASVACARRGGCSATFDELNKYFTISGMPVASSQYWNSIHGRTPGEAEQDGEGLQTMRTLARNMTFLMRSIALGKVWCSAAPGGAGPQRGRSSMWIWCSAPMPCGNSRSFCGRCTRPGNGSCCGQ